MADDKKLKKPQIARSKVLHAAAKLFLEIGYAETTIKRIAEHSGIAVGSVGHMFDNKEGMVCELVGNVIECQFAEVTKLLDGVTDDPILFYAVETVLQLNIAESSEHMREMYSVAYSLPNSAQVVYRTVTAKHQEIFKEYYPDYEAKDFYEKEIACGGIMRGFLTVPCDIYFTIDRKVKAFLENTFLLYGVPMEKINQAIEFVKGFDFDNLAKKTLDGMFEFLADKI